MTVEEFPTEATNKVDVYYLIAEGSQYLVKEINFNLDKKISRKIKSFMVTKENRWYKRSFFNFNQLTSDRGRMIFQLKNLGFFRAGDKRN